MVLGEKLWEEKGKAIGVSVKSVGAEGVAMEISFASEVHGFGRCPSGKNMGTLSVLQRPSTSTSTGRGVFVTTEGESLPWHYVGVAKIVGGRTKGPGLVTYNTHSQKFAWMNDLLCLLEGEGAADLSDFSDTGHEWK